MSTSVRTGDEQGAQAQCALGDPRIVVVEVMLPVAHVHPDPFQPRIDCDAELAESIKSQGVLQAISVEPAQELDVVCEHCGNTFIELAALGHFMISDGERRWRGSIAAKQTEILAKIIPPTSEGDRLKRQLTSNTGKPLTPVEEAIAFKRLMETEEWSQVELAKQLGRPRATIGDRLRLVDLDDAWLKLIGKGVLQVSHAAIIHKYSAVPTAYQAKAAAALVHDYRAEKYIDEGDAIPVDEFKHLIYVAFRDYIKKLSDVPGYKGPVITIAGSSYDRGESKYAADITLWRPIHRKRENARRKQSSGSGSSRTRSAAPRRSQEEIDLEALAQIAPVLEGKSHSAEPQKGETEIYDSRRGWSDELDPEVLLASLPASSLKIRKPRSSYGSTIVVTTDGSAIAKARAAHMDSVKAAARTACAKVLGQLTDDVLRKCQLAGPGALVFVGAMDQRKDPAAIVLAFALGLELAVHNHKGDTRYSVVRQADAERLLSALAATSALKLKLPDWWSLESSLTPKRQAVRFKLPEATSKKQQKREARARGEQVGDPTRTVATA